MLEREHTVRIFLFIMSIPTCAVSCLTSCVSDIVYSFCLLFSYSLVLPPPLFDTRERHLPHMLHGVECCTSQVHYSFCPVLNNFAMSMFAYCVLFYLFYYLSFVAYFHAIVFISLCMFVY